MWFFFLFFHPFFCDRGGAGRRAGVKRVGSAWTGAYYNNSGFSVETKGALFFSFFFPNIYLFKMRSSLQVLLARGSVLAW